MHILAALFVYQCDQSGQPCLGGDVHYFSSILDAKEFQPSISSKASTALGDPPACGSRQCWLHGPVTLSIVTN